MKMRTSLDSFYCWLDRPIDSLLSAENVDLDAVIRSPDLIQEISGLNADLIAYLKKPEIMMSLFKFVTDPAPESDEFGHYKVPYQAAESIACFPAKDLVEPAQNEEVIKALFAMFEGQAIRKT